QRDVPASATRLSSDLIGVLAHETGHIAGGHLARMREMLASVTTASIIAMILGVGAMVAAGRSGSQDLGQAGSAANISRMRARCQIRKAHASTPATDPT